QVRALASYLDREAARQQQAQAVAAQGAAPAVMRPPPRRLVIPVLHQRDQMLLWEEDNRWRPAWDAALRRYPGDRVVLPQGDAEDMALLSREALHRGDTAPMARLRERYHTDEVMVVEAWLQPLARINRVQIR